MEKYDVKIGEGSIVIPVSSKERQAELNYRHYRNQLYEDRIKMLESLLKEEQTFRTITVMAISIVALIASIISIWK